MYSLLKELGMEFFPQNVKGKKAYLKSSGESIFYSGMIPPISWLTLIDLQIAIWKFGIFLFFKSIFFFLFF